MNIIQVSKEKRMKGCSDSEAKAILNFLLELQESAWMEAEIYESLRALFIDILTFVPVIRGKQDLKKAHLEPLPNAIYKKVIIYLILNVDQFSSGKLKKLANIFTNIEENNVTGFSYVSIHGRVYPLIKDVLDKTQTYYEIVDYSDHLANNKLDKGIALHNTLIVLLINQLMS